MENRRQTYRHSFESQEGLRAEIHRRGQRATLACELLDLSLGGVRVRLQDAINPLRIGDSVGFRLLGRDAPSPVELRLSLPSQVVYLERHGEDWHCGLRFLPLADSRANEQIERTLACFLLVEQQRKRHPPSEGS